MANRNKSELRAEVLNRLAESGTSGFYTSTQIDQWLNDGVADLCTAIEPLRSVTTRTTATDTMEYTLPEDLLSIKLVQYLDTADDWYALTETTWETLLRQSPNFENDASGQPAQWYKRQNIIGLVPAPSSTYADTNALRLMYSYTPDAMSGDSDTTGLEPWLDDAIILFAVRRGYLKDRDFDRAEAVGEEYSRALAEAAIKLNRQREEHAPRLVPGQASYRGFYQSRMRRTRIWSD